MKSTAVTALLAVFVLSFASQAVARNVKYTLPIAATLQSAAASAGFGIDPTIKLYFGPQKAPENAQPLGSASATGKVRIIKKQDLPSCQASFVQALEQLQKDAKSINANAVMNIVSYYPKEAPLVSEKEFDCWAGSFSTILMLKGDFVRVAD
ncbi:MAG: hypothetical protein JWR21_151 [Herminiimonas sp.]|nr:hypothetical protein [Herminiimonas sp.]MDB5854491.1 hypothetical protein [Herminiimonas sp.]